MANEPDKVAGGDLAWQTVLGASWGPFNAALGAVDIPSILHEVHDLSNVDQERCPTCGSPLVVRTGRFGPFIACAKYPDECRFTKPIGRDKVPDKPSDEICKECGAPMVIKTGRLGEFLGRTPYPSGHATPPR